MSTILFGQEINLLAVLLSAVIFMVVGGLWYSKFLFSNAWSKENGRSMEEINGDAGFMPFVFLFVGALVLSTVLSWTLSATVANTLVSSLRVGFLLWLAFTFVPMAGCHMMSGRSWKLIAIDSLNYLVTILLASAVLWYM
jgi:hypothetical protein